MAVMRLKNFFHFFLLLMSMLATSCGQPTSDNTQISEKSEVPVSTQTPYIIIVTATSIPEVLTETPSITSTPAPQREKAQVVEVIDGDTIKVLINGETFSVRYIGIDTPEVQFGEWMGKEAYDANIKLIIGNEVYLEKDVSDTDQYNRLLRYVFLANGTFINAELVRLGVASSIAYPPDVKYQYMFDELEQEARYEGIGLWVSTQTPEINSDTSAGSDTNIQIISVDKRAEYVDIMNFGNFAVSLNGWILRSEKGNQDCYLSGNLESGVTLRIWALAADDEEEGYNCGKGSNIWNNSEPDPAVLFNSNYEEVDRY